MLAATTEVAVTTVPVTLVKSITLALALNNPEIVPEFTSKLGATLDVAEGVDTVSDALGILPTVALMIKLKALNLSLMCWVYYQY